MIVTGIFVCSGSLLAGALAGASLNCFIPGHFKKTLSLIASPIPVSMGIHFISKLHNLPPTALAIIVDTTIGSLLNIEGQVEWAKTTLRTSIEHIFPTRTSANVSAEDFINQSIIVLVLLCTNGTSISGTLTRGVTGDPTTLLIRSVLDFFTAAVFISTLGYVITVTFIPQLAIFIILSFAATFIIVLINPAVIADFTACGSVIILVIGFRPCGIHVFSTVSMLLLLLPIVPSSAA